MNDDNLNKIRECVDELFLLDKKAEAREQKLSKDCTSALQKLNDLILISKQQLETVGQSAEKLGEDLKVSEKRYKRSVKMVAISVIVTFVCFAVISHAIVKFKRDVGADMAYISYLDKKIAKLSFIKKLDDGYYVRIVPGTEQKNKFYGDAGTFAKVDMR